jgi:restriction system protein
MKTFKYKFDDLMNPCLTALHKLGSSGTNDEIEDEVIRILRLTDDDVGYIHRGNVTKLNYLLRWARNYLKRAGVIDNSARGVWSLTAKGQALKDVDPKEIAKQVRALDQVKRKNRLPEPDEEDEDEVEELTWQDELLQILKALPSDSFERLSQRLLRELGFKNVEVTGRSDDGGIDGKGILNIGSVITFSVVFQCKRYKGSVSAGAVRDFRGAVQGKADKGLLITTGTFTRDARVEAQRDGALAIDLLDGNELASRLKDLRLGVTVEQVERVTVTPEWYKSF